jgi:hypothetical protein
MDINFLTSPTASIVKSETHDQGDLVFPCASVHSRPDEDEPEASSSPISSPWPSAAPSQGQESPIRRASQGYGAARNLEPLQAKELWVEKEATAPSRQMHKFTATKEVHEQPP